MNGNNELVLTELIDIDVLQKVQDSFAKLSNMTAYVVDKYGMPVIKGANYSDFCENLTKKSNFGNSMCEECERFGEEEALAINGTNVYYCHSGLMEFNSPLFVEGNYIGSLIGGRVFTEVPDEEFIRSQAETFEIDGDTYWEAAKKIPVLYKEDVKRSLDFLKIVVDLLTAMAQSKYLTDKANKDLENAAKMQADFLANMSHEIRTPMNAVIGFSELALRENLPSTARDNIEQIQSSGKALLNIINDILDFSKIESGKLDIIIAPYEPLSVIDDVANITMTRLTEKDVELILKVDPNIPCKLEGDNLRIRQVLINLCNNATKFTQQGTVTINVSFEWVGYESIKLNFAISDTGIGIKEEDIDKIFNSFQQVDSKRNRNIEGTGLGLAICRQLLTLMDSNLVVESTYGQGSTFSFSVIQNVVDARPSVLVENAENVVVGARFKSQGLEENFINDCRALGIEPSLYSDEDTSIKIENLKKWIESIDSNKEIYFFIEQREFDSEVFKYVTDNHMINSIMVAETFSDVRDWASKNDLLIVRKPVSVIDLGNLFNHQSLRFRREDNNDIIYDFSAEDANILIVDDNIVNLTVAQGLLEPINAKIDIASSGKEAIRMARLKKYDLIFMDHMMPDIDGIETSKIIRKEQLEYKDIPIIALTANAMNGVKEMFISEGLDDFIPKPIEVKVLIDMVKKYLPKEKITKGNTITDITQSAESEETVVIADLDTQNAISLLGSKALYMSVLRIYFDSIDSKANNIEELYNTGDWAKYAVEVHALKSSSRQIGAMELGELAYELEMAGKNLNLELIHNKNSELLRRYREYIEKLAPYLQLNKSEDTKKTVATRENLEPLFEQMRIACDNLDIDAMEEVIHKLDKFEFNEIWTYKMKALRNAVNDMDVDECLDVLDSWN